MISTPRSRCPFGAIFARFIHGRDRNCEERRTQLIDFAQLALQVEFATIPVYLTGMYSIADRSCAAYQTLRSVVMEEMFHANLAANLVVALGGRPRFTDDAAPVYPGYLPHANEATTPRIGLFRASAEVFNKVYAAIESPAPGGAPAQDDRYDSIAQLYGALREAIDAYPGNPFEVSPGKCRGRQRTDIYLGKFGGQVVEVTDKASALHAIKQIVEQGEGIVPGGEKPLVPVEPFGAYNHYGPRTDGTYGPIIGTPEEMSHFMKFRQIAFATTTFPETLPILSDPSLDQFSNPDARQLAEAFNRAYSLMLVNFERSFSNEGDPYFGIVLQLMHRVLPGLAVSLMNTPAHAGGDASVGPNAAPTWTYLPMERKEEDCGECIEGLERLLSGGAPETPSAQALAHALDAWRHLAAPPLTSAT
ncbi:MAG: ferritin-like protein [Verrucomicrobiae bacterium]|nr:ferritin-like protein [Verrucomicrobiae bacterium]